MNVHDLDQQIEALPNSDYSALSDAAMGHWTFRAETTVLASIAVLIPGAMLFFAGDIVRLLWPGSRVAFVTLVILCFALLFVLIRLITSSTATDWRVQRALRRQYTYGHPKRAP